MTNLKQFDGMLEYVTQIIQRNHDAVEEVKDRYMRYQYYLHGKGAVDPFQNTPSQDSAHHGAHPIGMAQPGPHPFATPIGNVTLMEMAKQSGLQASNSGLFGGGTTQMGGTTGAGGGLFGTSTGLFGQQTNTGGSLFGGGQTAQKPMLGGTTSLFGGPSSAAPAFPTFGSSTAAPTASSGSTSLFGSNNQKLSSPFSSRTSGTLFGGAAASPNVGIAKPFGR